MKSTEKNINKKTRILHIGNVANNAYQNAKILNNHGYDNMVLSFDYYHVMGCPEWDDAVIEGEIKNQNYPQWHKVKLNGFRRPDWFVSAPLKICVKYIEAYSQDKKIAAYFWKKVVSASRRYISNKESGNFAFVFKFIKFLITSISILYCLSLKVLFKCIELFQFNKKKSSVEAVNSNNCENSVRARVERDFKELFPDRKCEFGNELDNYIACASFFAPALKYFDVVFAYATNPIFMYLLGKTDYIAYEHGTIRDFPYEDSDFGRLMLLSYAKAKAIYCTNIDCYESAKYITQRTQTPIICGLHGIDINALVSKIDNAKNENNNNSNFISKLKKP